jgi:RsiW-degrading membrane proteinase PrsW (M82 family)
MTSASLGFAAFLLIAVPAVEVGGLSLLYMIGKRDPGYLDNPVRRHLFRAGHAHAGVWIIFALVAMLYVDQANLSDLTKMIVRICFGAAPILMPLGFFLSIVPSRAERPNKVITLVYLGGLLLGIGAVTLGIGLLRI